MLPTLINEPFSDPNWIYETKWDGYRAICFVSSGEHRLVSRNQIDMTAAFPELGDVSRSLNARIAILDGEIVALGADGLPSFQMLQGRLGLKGGKRSRSRSGRIVFYAFDLIYHDGFDLQSCALVDRKDLLSRILQQTNSVRYSDHFEEQGTVLYEKAAELGIEGIVAKKRASRYVQGRTREWLKIKPEKTAEVVICGYTEPQNSRQYFGGLVTGVYDRGTLVYSGRVGSGFSDDRLKEAFQKLNAVRTESSPFATAIPVKDVHWVNPSLVAEVRYLERTNAGELRHPVFLRWRTDKSPDECSLDQFV